MANAEEEIAVEDDAAALAAALAVKLPTPVVVVVMVMVVDGEEEAEAEGGRRQVVIVPPRQALGTTPTSCMWEEPKCPFERKSYRNSF